MYHITFTRRTADAAGGPDLLLDGQPLPGPALPLTDDHREHTVAWTGGDPASPPARPPANPPRLLTTA